MKASYVMAYFDSESYSLRLAESHDGFAWTEIEGVDFAPRIGDWKTFRDPSLLQDVEGRFRLTWTTGSNGFGYARSEDLFEWSDVTFVRIDRGSLERPVLYTWAPELFHDEQKGDYVVVFTAGTENVPTLSKRWKGNFRSYYVRTREFAEFSDPKLLLDPHPPLYEIDGALLQVRGMTYFFTKIEADNPVDGKKDGIHYASASSLEGPWVGAHSGTTARDVERLRGSFTRVDGRGMHPLL